MKDYLCKKLFNRLSGTLVIRARCGNNITGLACCNILYPSPRYSGQLHIKELYVSQCDRNKGTGKAIMRFIARLALEQECLREGANKQVISSQADSLIKISRIWADFFPANTSNQPI
ncbi:GNAT family N-acetyltransferase [Klebsiella pneumoniae]